MIKHFLLLMLIWSVSIVAFAQKKSDKSYKQLPAVYRYRDSLIRFIMPDTACTYWEFNQAFSSGRGKYKRTIFSKGVKPDSIKFENPQSKMLVKCLPGSCFHYVAYIWHGKVGYITSNEAFKKFIGRIDNIAEAVLVAEVYTGLFNYVDADPRGGSYKMSKKDFDIKLCHYELCPETKSSYHIIVGRDGNVEPKECEVYYRSKDCVEI